MAHLLWKGEKESIISGLPLPCCQKRVAQKSHLSKKCIRCKKVILRFMTQVIVHRPTVRRLSRGNKHLISIGSLFCAPVSFTMHHSSCCALYLSPPPFFAGMVGWPGGKSLFFRCRRAIVSIWAQMRENEDRLYLHWVRVSMSLSFEKSKSVGRPRTTTRTIKRPEFRCYGKPRYSIWDLFLLFAMCAM